MSKTIKPIPVDATRASNDGGRPKPIKSTPADATRASNDGNRSETIKSTPANAARASSDGSRSEAIKAISADTTRASSDGRRSEPITATSPDTTLVSSDGGMSETTTSPDTTRASNDGNRSETIKLTPADTTAVDVWTHSSTGFPGAWPEDEVDLLLDAWHELIEEVRAPKKRSDAPYKVLKRLRKKGLKQVGKEAVRKQMNNLNTEYKTYLGLEKSGVQTVKAKCFSMLEKILGPASNLQKDLSSEMSKESDHPLRMASTAEESAVEDTETLPDDQETNPDTTESLDEEGGSRKRRFKGRMNIRRLAQLQQSILSEIQALQKAKIEADEKIQQLLTTIVDLHKATIENQEKVIESLKVLKL